MITEQYPPLYVMGQELRWDTKTTLAVNAFNYIVAPLFDEEVAIIAGGSARLAFSHRYTNPKITATPVKDIDVFFYSLEAYDKVLNEIAGRSEWNELAENENHAPSVECKTRYIMDGVIFEFIIYPEFAYEDEEGNAESVLRDFDFDICRAGLGIPFADNAAQLHYLPIVHHKGHSSVAIVNYRTPKQTRARITRYKEIGYTFSPAQVKKIDDLLADEPFDVVPF